MADSGITISELWQSIEKRFDKQDQLLDNLQRAQSSFATKSDVTRLDSKIDVIDDRVKEIEKIDVKEFGKIESRDRSIHLMQALVWPFVGIGLTITALILRH